LETGLCFSIIIPIFAAMLRIGFDAKRAFLNRTGLGNYSRSVISSLATLYPEEHYFLYTPKTGNDTQNQALLDNPAISIRTPQLPILTSAWRIRFVVPQLQKDELDIYHGLSHEIPAGLQTTGIKSVVTIHDLIFLRYPQYYKAPDRKIYDLKFRNACKNADLIIAVSEQTKKDIVRFFRIDPRRIKVVYQSCDHAFRQICSTERLQEVKEKYNLPEQYILNVGTIEERKNLMLIAKALKQLPDQLKLVVIGKETSYASKVKSYLKEQELEDRVSFLEGVPFSDLPAIYQQASVFVYPSEFEGFGIPILEALCSGVPVIAATGSCLEEAGGPDSIYIDPKDDKALASAIKRLMQSSELQEQMISKGKEFAAAFTEEEHAHSLMRLYRGLVRK
jgi:glycosyltransferase involved in cell wall biosynthesis